MTRNGASGPLPPSIDDELLIVRQSRGDRWFIECESRHCIAEAEFLLKEQAPGWQDEHIMFIGIRWHPSRRMSESTAWRRDGDPPDAVRLPVRNFDHVVHGSGAAYIALERSGGRLPKGRLPRWTEAHKSDARITFAIVSACLVIFEGQMLREAEQGGTVVDWWAATYWLRRFHGNMLRVRDDSLIKRAAGRKGSGSRALDANARRDRIDTVFRSLPKWVGPRQAPGEVAKKVAGVSLPTIRKHLVALGHRKEKPK